MVFFASCGVNPSRYENFTSINLPQDNTEKTFSLDATDYKTNIGDTVEIFVLEDNSFNGKYVIRSSGDIIMPKLGRIHAAKLGLKDLELAIKNELESKQLKIATVIADPVKGASTEGFVQPGLTIYISGSVAKTGRQFVPIVVGNSVTALQAVINSGGFTSFANKKKSFLLRRGNHEGSLRIPLNFSAIEEGKLEDIPLLEGDMIVVPQKMFGF